MLAGDAGVGSVFSREFYEIAAGQLKPGGIMAQWFHIYEMHDGIVELVFRTFSSVYPYVEIWEPADGDLVLLGSMKPWTSTPELFAKTFERTRPRMDLEEVGIKSPAAVFARQLDLAREAGKPIVIHTREAWADTMRILRERYQGEGIFHCFTGGPELKKAMLDIEHQLKDAYTQAGIKTVR